MTTPMLEVRNLHVRVENKPILKGLDLRLEAGQVHAVMGPNGSGKSTLAQVLAGRDTFEVTQGQVLYQGRDLLSMSPEDRARAGIFMAFQYPVEIPGVSNNYFVKAAVNAVRRARGQEELDAVDFLEAAKARMKDLKLDEPLMNRSLNEGFSGGEKKRNEIFQLAMLEPTLAVLDETDSGLDIDALQVVSKAVNAMRSPQRAFLVITHYQRILDYIHPDRVHILVGGRIAQSGGPELALEVEKRGYAWLEATPGSA